MKLPSLLSIKKPCQNMNRSCLNSDRLETFGKLPTDVRKLPKRELSPLGKLVFGEYADRSKGTNCRVLASESDIAEGCGIGRTSVIAALKQLQRAGLIEKSGDPVKQVQGYRITHWMFREPKPKETTAAVDNGKKRKPRWGGDITPTMVRCPRCSRHCGGLLKVGWCRRCNADDRTRRIADEQIAKAKSA